MAEINFGKSQLILVSVCMLISQITATSLPVRRQALYYPTGFGVQTLIPQASSVDRVDLNQRAQFVQRAPNPNEFAFVYANNAAVQQPAYAAIPTGSQQPNFNEIFPQVRPPLNPNAVFLPRPQGGVGIGGYQPGEPDNVLISNVRPQQDAEVFTSNAQPFPSGPSGFAPFNFNVQPVYQFRPQNIPQQQPAEQPDNKPEKIKSSRLELVDEESTKPQKPAGEQEVLAAADKNPTGPAQKANQFPYVQPGQRFFILNGQPQFLMYQAIPYPQFQQIQEVIPNDPRYYQPTAPQTTNQEIQPKPTNQEQQNVPLKLQLVPKPTPEQRDFYTSRQVFGGPTFLRALSGFGPNPQGLEPGVNLRNNKSEPQKEEPAGVVYDYSRYTKERQTDAKSSPQDE